MPTVEERLAFYGVAYGGLIAIGATFLAVGFAFGIESYKAKEISDVVDFFKLFWEYLIFGILMIGLGYLGAARKFLGWGKDKPKKAKDERQLER